MEVASLCHLFDITFKIVPLKAVLKYSIFNRRYSIIMPTPALSEPNGHQAIDKQA